jgi:hypothetical protein
VPRFDEDPIEIAAGSEVDGVGHGRSPGEEAARAMPS